MRAFSSSFRKYAVSKDLGTRKMQQAAQIIVMMPSIT